jgi:hypothetical protein
VGDGQVDADQLLHLAAGMQLDRRSAELLGI